jgi:hypothetical protein
MKKILFSLLFSFNCLVLLAQDPTFTQFYANPVYLNPALAGSSGCPRVALNYRNQWPQLTGNYVTYAASYDSYFKNIPQKYLQVYDQNTHDCEVIDMSHYLKNKTDFLPDGDHISFAAYKKCTTYLDSIVRLNK